MIGRRLGNFELIDQLGGGAWGKVYRARQVTLGGRPVAVKVLWPQLAEDTRARQRFLDEAHNMARLSHPNVVKVIDVGEEGGTYYFAMEYIEGESLSEVMAREGPMSAGRAAELGVQIADALGHAHSRGMVHRDIKPANILLDAEGRPIVTDFGIAKVGEGSGLTATGMSIGTPEYMSPEQAKGNPIDGRSDIYSLGVVLYQMVCGQAPFTATTPFAVGMKHINEPPRDPRELRPDCPEWLATIIMRALAKEPFDRFGTAQEIAATLRAAKPVTPLTVEVPANTRPTVPYVTPTSAQPPARETPAVRVTPRRVGMNWAVVGVAVGIGAIVALMVGLGVLKYGHKTASVAGPRLDEGGDSGGPVAPPRIQPSEEDSVQKVIQRWRNSWESHDLQTFMTCFWPDAIVDGMNVERYRAYHARENARQPYMDITLGDMKVFVTGSLARAVFIQHFHGWGPKSDYESEGRKVLTFERRNGEWKIAGEEFERFWGRGH